MWAGTSEVHHLVMQNLENTQVLITALRQTRETDARRRRLARRASRPHHRPFIERFPARG